MGQNNTAGSAEPLESILQNPDVKREYFDSFYGRDMGGAASECEGFHVDYLECLVQNSDCIQEYVGRLTCLAQKHSPEFVQKLPDEGKITLEDFGPFEEKVKQSAPKVAPVEFSVIREIQECTNHGTAERVCYAHLHPSLNYDLDVCLSKNKESVKACMAEGKALVAAVALTERQIFERVVAERRQALNL